MEPTAAQREWKKELRELRREMKLAGIRRISFMNGGLDGETRAYNFRCFQLETWIKQVDKQTKIGG